MSDLEQKPWSEFLPREGEKRCESRHMGAHCELRDGHRSDHVEDGVSMWDDEDEATELRTLTETQARELGELRTLLRDCEWPDVGGAEFNLIQCPSCRQIHEYTFEREGGRTHKPGCKLAAALAVEKKT